LVKVLVDVARSREFEFQRYNGSPQSKVTPVLELGSTLGLIKEMAMRPVAISIILYGFFAKLSGRCKLVCDINTLAQKRFSMRVLYSIFLLPALCLAQAPAPAISFDNTHHDFGRIFQDEVVSYRYRVSNKGSAPLQIKEIRPSCGCSYTVLGQRTIPPGESTFIEVRFDPTGMMGTIHKSLDVISDDPSSPNSLLTFEASVVQEIMPSTTVVFFREVSRSASASSKIHLQSGDEQPIVVTEAKIPGAPYLSCSPQKNGNDVTLNISIDGRLIPKQSLRGTDILTVRTTNRKFPVLQFQVQWDVQSAIVAAPSRITWTGSAGSELRTTVSLSNPDGSPFRILEAKSSSSLIRAVNIGKNSAAEQKFDVILSPKAKAGAYRELLTLKLDNPEQQTLEIAVVAILQ